MSSLSLYWEHHTHCVTSHSDNVWNILHYTRLHILTLWHQATVFMTSHPLYLTSYPLDLCHHIHCIDDITPTEFLRFHPLYMNTSYPLHMTSQLLNVCHHTHSFNNITRFEYRTWHPLYVKYHMHSIKHHVHILWHHTTLCMTSHSLYSWHHHQYIWNGIQRICVITMTPLMVSDQLYVWYHTRFTHDILCTLHNVTSNLYDFTSL